MGGIAWLELTLELVDASLMSERQERLEREGGRESNKTGREEGRGGERSEVLGVPQNTYPSKSHF